MITLLNFGDTPFYALFIIVSVVVVAVIAANITAAAMTFVIDKYTNLLLRKYERHDATKK